jgi:hypothetical protein
MRIKARREIDGLTAICGLAGYTDIGLVFEDTPESSAYEAVVIH